jgi:hypothetical protein
MRTRLRPRGRYPNLVVLAPRDDSEQAEAFAKAAGTRMALLGSLADGSAVLNQLLAV